MTARGRLCCAHGPRVAPRPAPLPGPRPAPGPSPAGSVRAEVGTHRPVFRVRSLPDLLSLVPVVLGFEPQDSLVVVALAGPRPGFSVRVDLPPPADAAAAVQLGEQVAAAVAAQGGSRAAVLAFSRDAGCEATLQRVASVVGAAGIDVVDVVRTDGARYWSLVCGDPRCCPPEGSGYDPRASRVRAEATWAGIAVAPHRDALAARLAACSGPRAARMRTATAAAQRQVLAELGLPAGRAGRPPRGLLQVTGEGAACGVARVDALLDRLLDRLPGQRSGEDDGMSAGVDDGGPTA